MIFCDFNYCIYNKKSQCQLRCISVSSLGICDDCIVPSFSEEIVNKYKKEALERLETQTINYKTPPRKKTSGLASKKPKD